MDFDTETNLTEIVEKAFSLYKSEDNSECLELTEKGLALLKSYPHKDITSEFNLRFARGIAYWQQEKLFEAFTQISNCLMLIEENHQAIAGLKMRRLMFCYLLCAELCTYISMEETGIKALFQNAESFMKNAHRHDLLIVVKHLKSQVLYRIHKVDEALPMAEEALAEKKLAKAFDTGCDILCYLNVYATLLATTGQREKGLAILNDAMADTAHKPALHEQKGLIYLKSGEYNLAKEEFDAALLFSTNADLLINRAWCHWLSNDKYSAREDAEAAYLDDPCRLTVVLWYSFLHGDNSVMKDWTSTEDEFESALARFWMDEFSETKLFLLAGKQQLQQQALTYAYLFAVLKAEQGKNMCRAKECYAYMSSNVLLDHYCYGWVTRRHEEISKNILTVNQGIK